MEHWWNKLQNQCRICKKYLAMELVEENQDWFFWTCKFCGFQRKHERAWAKYWHKDGKVFLKRRDWGKYREVELLQTDKYLQVVIKQPKNQLIWTKS